MRKPLIVIMSIIFTGALLVYTGQANLNLLEQIYINPQYVAFGMLTLEGGVLYWLGYYLLHWDANHKALALTMTVIDFILSMVGFFLDLNLHTGDQVKTALPPVLVVMSIDVMLNVGVGLLIHFLSHGTAPEVPVPPPRERIAQPKEEPASKRLAQTSEPMRLPGPRRGVKNVLSEWWNGTGVSQRSAPVEAGETVVEEKESSPLASPPLTTASQSNGVNGHKA